MPVGLNAPAFLTPVAGVRIATVALGGRREPREDLTLFELAPGAACAATFTRNAFCAAPVIVAREHISRTAPRYLLVNAGNANAGTGEHGLEDARRCCAMVAEATGAPVPRASLPFSTGVIGEPLAVERFEQAIPIADRAVERRRLGRRGGRHRHHRHRSQGCVPRTVDLGGGTGGGDRRSPRVRA